MTVTNTTHINFDGDARAALEFYRSVFGGELTLMTYADFHQAEQAADPQRIVWGGLVADSGFRVMAYDVQLDRPYDRGANTFYESVRGQTVEEITAIWEPLIVGGEIRTPLAPAPWSPAYGMATDRFGITWVLDVEVAYGETER